MVIKMENRIVDGIETEEDTLKINQALGHIEEAKKIILSLNMFNHPSLAETKRMIIIDLDSDSEWIRNRKMWFDYYEGTREEFMNQENQVQLGN